MVGGLIETEAGWWFLVGATDGGVTVLVVDERPGLRLRRGRMTATVLTAEEAAKLGAELLAAARRAPGTRRSR